jgi:hypothetical protein
MYEKGARQEVDLKSDRVWRRLVFCRLSDGT